MKFDKDSGHVVEEYRLGVVYVGHPQRQSTVREVSNEDLSHQASVFPDEVSFYFIGIHY